ncbi:MAG: 50S ribosomal protein L15 [Candidatus Shapirobacteria bacterium]|nr:50S ribosomal protein L15 [Candidatus Shapirobacteria bacterium]MDD4410691.1 50S ribosomal protein L15 [Candidatus Shapirobacteria bacterium]
MEILSKLTKITQKPARRCGRGIGSGLGGHTSGRGTKGDKARGSTALAFAGTKHKKSWIKRLPFMRGKHRLQNQKNIVNINLNQIEKWFKVNEIVDAASLAKNSKTSLKNFHSSFKILATGNITKALKFKGLSLSKVAQNKIIAAGGNIE